ncbi:MAG: 4Fe-4S binding protein [Lachnospiraceae bacterium]|nr:4Fe-4S binding protein [Lachnospiraceae bacterium]MBR3036664.1 4Fe-4S binding protein [Lachnospiraceae bacterium]
MESYQHSVLLDESKCKGCTTCLHHCPTEAIRIKDGHAVINADRCIDCGECIRRCPHNAKRSVMSNLSTMRDPKYKYKIALPAPTLYGQFENLDDIDFVLNGLIKIGFDEVFEVAKAAEIVTAHTRQYIKTEGIPMPIISSACPVVVRLIGLLYPSLSEHIMHLLPPVEVAAKLARKKALEEHPELTSEDIGIFFISPCPAKASYVHNYKEFYDLNVDEILSISDIYFELINAMKRDDTLQPLLDSGMIGIGWASSGGESAAILNDDYLAADGIENVIHVLNQIEDGNISQVKFIELNACPGGCVGGVLTVQNPFIARARLQSLKRYLPVSMYNSVQEDYIPDELFFDVLPDYVPVGKLGNSMAESMRMMAKIQKLREGLPGIDCGACGAPSCRANAEDAVKAGLSCADCPLQKRAE